MTQTKAELLETKHQGDIRLGDANSSHYVGFKAPATVGTSLVWTLPAADGTAGYYLKTDGSGNLGWSIDNSGVSLSGSTNNTIATVTGANALQGEATFTYTGTDTLEIQPASATPAIFIGDSNRTGAGQGLVQYKGNWNGTTVARITMDSGDDTTNKDNGIIRFDTAAAGSTSEAMRIDVDGRILVNTTTKSTSGASNHALLSIAGNKASATGEGQLNLWKKAVPGVNDTLGRINFIGDGGDPGAVIKAEADLAWDQGGDTSDHPGRLLFCTTADNDANVTERMRIDNAGRVGIGTGTSTSGFDKFVVKGTGNVIAAEAASGAVGIGLFENGTGRFYIKSLNGSDGLAFVDGDNSSERFRIGASGQLGIGGATYGTSGQVLTSGGSGAAPSWADAAGGGATPTVKTANYTAASGDLVVVNGSGLTITLPSSPSVADSVEVRILGSRYCTIARNGSNIESTASNFYMDTFDGHTKFIYTDSTRGWLVA